LDVQGVPGKERGGERAAPQGAGHLFQSQKQEGGISGVEEQAGQVVPARFEAEPLHVEGV
jgi:hypothetical protein